MFHYSVGVFGFAFPFFGDGDHQPGIVFCYVVQVVGDAAPHKFGRVMFEVLEDGKYGRRIFL